MTWAERLRGLRMDVTPLRESRDFRLLFVAGTVFYLGGMVSYVAIPFQIYRLTGSNFAVGAIGLAELVPLVVFGLYGGALADHVDRRRLLIWTGVAQAAFTAVLAVNAFREDPSVWLIFVVAALLASSSSMQRPSREALMPRTVRHDQIVAANALTSLGMQVGVLIGPAIGGLLVAYVGIGWCFVVDIVGLAVATLLYIAMRPYPHRAETTPPSLAGIGEGLRYALSRRDLLGTYLVDIAAMLLALPVVLFPALAEEVFERPELLGLLYSAETVGALLATALSGWTARIHHHGRAIVIAAAAYGACIGFAGLMPTIWLVMVFFLLAGRRRHDLGGLPQHGLEPDHPRGHARPAGRDRDAVLLARPARRAGPRRHHRRPLVGACRDRQRRLRLRRRCHADRAGAPRLLVVRRPHRRARRGRARRPCTRGRGRRALTRPAACT
jgi:MFS family permease